MGHTDRGEAGDDTLSADGTDTTLKGDDNNDTFLVGAGIHTVDRQGGSNTLDLIRGAAAADKNAPPRVPGAATASNASTAGAPRGGRRDGEGVERGHRRGPGGDAPGHRGDGLLQLGEPERVDRVRRDRQP